MDALAARLQLAVAREPLGAERQAGEAAVEFAEHSAALLRQDLLRLHLSAHLPPPPSSPQRTPPTLAVANADLADAAGRAALLLAADELSDWPTSAEADAAIARRGVPIRTRQTTTLPAFAFSVTDPELDTDLSKEFMRDGQWEGGISQIFHRALSACCRQPGDDDVDPMDDTAGNTNNGRSQGTNASAAGRPGRGVVVDVGGNMGWYAALSAMHGCRVEVFEPVPLFSEFLQKNVAMNDLANSVRWHDLLVSDRVVPAVTLRVPRGTTRLLWGAVGVDNINMPNTGRHAETGVADPLMDIVRPMTTLDALLGPTLGAQCARKDRHRRPLARLCMLKADVEGHEANVLAGARELIQQCHPEHVQLEVSPGMIRNGNPASVEPGLERLRAELRALLADYHFHHVPFSIGKRVTGPHEWAARPRVEPAAAFGAERLLKMDWGYNTNGWFSRRDLDVADYLN